MKANQFFIDKSNILSAGQGIFTRVPIKAGTVVMVSFIKNEKNTGIFENDFTQSQASGKINHSYTPNLSSFWYKGVMYKKAIRNIAINEELTSNYADTMGIIAPLGYTLRMDFLWFEK